MDLKKINIVTSPDTPGDGLQSAFGAPPHLSDN